MRLDARNGKRARCREKMSGNVEDRRRTRPRSSCCSGSMRPGSTLTNSQQKPQLNSSPNKRLEKCHPGHRNISAYIENHVPPLSWGFISSRWWGDLLVCRL
jgi:hypothetical protein